MGISRATPVAARPRRTVCGTDRVMPFCACRARWPGRQASIGSRRTTRYLLLEQAIRECGGPVEANASRNATAHDRAIRAFDALGSDEQEPPGLATPCNRSGSASSLLGGGRICARRPRLVARLREPIRALPQVAYKASPALACIIGARRAWTVEMISSEEMPCK